MFEIKSSFAGLILSLSKIRLNKKDDLLFKMLMFTFICWPKIFILGVKDYFDQLGKSSNIRNFLTLFNHGGSDRIQKRYDHWFGFIINRITYLTALKLSLLELLLHNVNLIYKIWKHIEPKNIFQKRYHSSQPTIGYDSVLLFFFYCSHSLIIFPIFAQISKYCLFTKNQNRGEKYLLSFKNYDS